MSNPRTSDKSRVVDSTMTFLVLHPVRAASHAPPIGATSVSSDRPSHRRP